METQQISALFEQMPWPSDQLNNIVGTVSQLEVEPRIDSLVRMCVRR